MQAPVMICGVKVPFPQGKKPFPQQLAVMQKIIMSCTRSEHALLESPTGTGKTLALLCGSLAWQMKNATENAEQYAKLQLEYEEARKKLAEDVQKQLKAMAAAAQQQIKQVEDLKAGMATTGKASKHFPVAYDDGDDPFEKDRDGPRMIKPIPLPQKDPSGVVPVPQAAAALIQKALVIEEPVVPKKPYVKIFYSSRTHSQLAQVVAELKRCAPELLEGPDHKGLRMCVLGSREQYCINPEVTRDRNTNRNDSCKELIKRNGCSCHADAKKLAASTATQILDVEEISSLGRRRDQCPFFASKTKFESAHIVFLPYNYLIDPSIRRAMNIDLNGSVVIFDEAHNVEDVARDAGTIERTLESLSVMSKILNVVGKRNADLTASTEHLEDLFDSLCSWASERPAATSDNAGSKTENRTVLDGTEAVASWEASYGLIINADTVREYRSHFSLLQNPPQNSQFTDDDEGGGGAFGPSENKKREVLTSAAVSYIDSMLNVLELLAMEDFRYARDFRIATVSKWTSSAQAAQAESSMMRFLPEMEQELPREKKPRKSGNELSFCIWCMNPAVAFRAIRESARSLILTSGTLSPLKAFAAELGCEFKHTLEAAHVCDIRSQLFASAFQRMGNELLDATFRNAERLDYLSAIGDAVLTISKETPGGVLVFFPSYAMLERCQNRWKSSGMWETLEECKPISTETRGTTQEFEKSVLEYRKRCKEGNGGLFFAVFRGKLSEGIDFKDEAARAVIIIGIPYPNVKDIVVGLKKLHQDMARSRAPKNSPIMPLSGQEWYQQQAYRALNQALGRVIRHMNDYGAIILLDHRFGQLQVVENLSKWMRGAVRTIADVKDVASPLREFFERLRECPPGSTAAAMALRSQPSLSLATPPPPQLTAQSASQPSPPHYALSAKPATLRQKSVLAPSSTTSSASSGDCIDLTQDDDDEPQGRLHKVTRLAFSPATDDGAISTDGE